MRCEELLTPETVIVFSSPFLATKGGWKGKYLFVASEDIYLPVFNSFDMLRWQIDRPITRYWHNQPYATGEWFKLIRGEQGHIWAVNMIAALQMDAQVHYHEARRLQNERGVRHLVSEGDPDGPWREVVHSGGNSSGTEGGTPNTS